MYNAQFTADLIKKLLLEKNVTGKQMSTDLGLGVNTLSNIRRGDIKSVETFHLIADYLNCSVDYLLGRTNEPNGVYQNSNSGNIVNGNNGDNSPLTVNGKAAAPNKDTLTEQFMQKFEQLDFDDKVDVMQYVKNKK